MRSLFSFSLAQNSLSLQLCPGMRDYFKINCLLSNNGSRLSIQIKSNLKKNNRGTILFIKSSFVIILDDVALGMKIGVGTATFFVFKITWSARTVSACYIFTVRFSCVIFPI